MSILSRLERHLGRLAIPNLTLVLVMAQTLSLLLSFLHPSLLADLLLQGVAVQQGEIWRLVSFMLIPPGTHPLWAVFALYIFYFMGTSLEGAWGPFQYNVYLFIAWILTLAISFVFPQAPISNVFIMSSVFLAFAQLYPNFEFLLFFVLPVKVKYMAILTWGMNFLVLLSGPWEIRLMVLASVVNFFCFFGADILARWQARNRRQNFAARIQEVTGATLHRCEVCGATEKSAPDEDFRVCSSCTEGREYCQKHLRDHRHR